MYKAIVVLCSIYMPDGPCLNFEDDWGPYKTEELCKERVEEMVEVIMVMPHALPPPYTLGYRCEGGEMT